MADPTKPIQTIYTDQELQKFLSDTSFSSNSNPAWDLERSSPMSTLKQMIREYHTKNVADNKAIAVAQVLRIEEGQQSLYQTINPSDTENNTQLVRYRVISDRRHGWLPEPKNNLDDKNNNIISLHPLAKYEMPTGDTVSPLKAGDIVEVQFKDTKIPYSSYFETANVIQKAGNIDNIGQNTQNRCANVTLPPLPLDSNADNIINDPCLIVGNMTDINMLDIRKQAYANKKTLVFPQFPVTTGERLTSEFGKIRSYTDTKGRPVRRKHFGADYDLTKWTPLLAAFDGEVIVSKYDSGGYGHYIVLKHNVYSLTPDGAPVVFFTLYAHLGSNDSSESINIKPKRVKMGTYVSRGQLIGLGGNSGLSISSNGGDGSHLHFEYILPLEGQTTFPGFARQVLDKTRKDPVGDFFRRGFFTTEDGGKFQQERFAREAAKARADTFGKASARRSRPTPGLGEID
jgi:murein DD-endopeptidase MepM/ murein hydrolase activator NlpD